MEVSVPGSITVKDFTANGTSYSTSDHSVASGTEALLAIWLTRVFSSNQQPVFAPTWDGVDLDEVATNYVTAASPMYDDIAFWAGVLASPAEGSKAFVLNPSLSQRCGTLLLINLVGADLADLVGALASQLSAATATSSVSLAITPETAGSLIIALLGIAQTTTLSAFAPASGWTEVDTDSIGDLLTRTIRYRIGATGSVPAGATFAASDVDIGGVVLEIRASSTSYQEEVEVAASAEVAASVPGPSKASAPAASWLEGQASWTSVLIQQADDADQGRNTVRIGDPASTRFLMRRKAVGISGAANVLACQATLADGQVQVESAAGLLTTQPSVACWAQQPGAGAQLTVDGSDLPPSQVAGATLSGGLQLGGFPVEVGACSVPSLPAYSGVLGRWIMDGRFWPVEQRKLFTRALLRPDLLWGWGEPDGPQDETRSPIAMPLERRLVGAAQISIAPLAIDPDGTQPDLVAVGAAAHGTVEIVSGRMRYRPDAGFLGLDGFSYTVSDGIKSSSSWVQVEVASQGLAAVDDEISVVVGGTVTINPKSNDGGGTGPLTITGLGSPTLGTASLTPENHVKFKAGSTPGTESFSYTISDGVDSAVGQINVEVSSSAPAAKANADSATTNQGQDVLVDVLGNDTPANATIDALTALPANGTAAVEAGKVRYKPASGFTGTDNFYYRIREPIGNTTSTAKVSLLVLSSGAEQEYPPCTGTLRSVTSVGQLSTALAAANGGDHIVIDDGLEFSSELVCNRPGDNAGKPIVIRGKNKPSDSSPMFKAGGRIASPWVMWWGLQFYGGSGIDVNADNARLRRLHVFDRASPAKLPTAVSGAITISGDDCRIEYLDMHHWWFRGCYWRRGTKRGKLHHAYIHDWISATSTESGMEPIRCGDAPDEYDDVTLDADAHEVRWLYMENINQATGQAEGENPSIKQPRHKGYDIHCKDVKFWTWRYCQYGRLERARFEGKGGVVVAGRGNVCNSVWITGSGKFEIQKGNWNSNQSGVPPAKKDSGVSPHASAYQTKLVGCKGPVLVGEGSDSIATAGTKILAHISGSISGPDSYTTGAADEPIYTPPTYTAASQGWRAGL